MTLTPASPPETNESQDSLIVAKKFLMGWTTGVDLFPYASHKEIAKRRAEACLGRAEQVGITKRELEKAAGGNLKRYFERAMEAAYDEVVKERAKK
jgi:hypothetical protein